MTVWIFKPSKTWAAGPINKTAIYTPKDEKYLADKAAVNQSYQAGVGIWANVVQPHSQQSGQSKDPEPIDPPTEIPDMNEAERIWKALVDSARGNG